MHFKRKLSRFNNFPNPNHPIVMNDFYYNKTFKNHRSRSFPPQNTLKLTYRTLEIQKCSRFNEKGNAGGRVGYRMGRGWKRENEEGRGHLRRERGENRQKAEGRWLGKGFAHRVGGVDAPVHCHSIRNTCNNFWDRINPMADPAAVCHQHSESRRLAFTESISAIHDNDH
jgi:hypothetical protein